MKLNTVNVSLWENIIKINKECFRNPDTYCGSHCPMFNITPVKKFEYSGTDVGSSSTGRFQAELSCSYKDVYLQIDPLSMTEEIRGMIDE